MDFNFTQDENDFRQEIKDWLSENLSQRISNKVKKFQRLDKNDYEEFMKALSAKGWPTLGTKCFHKLFIIIFV